MISDSRVTPFERTLIAHERISSSFLDQKKGVLTTSAMRQMIDVLVRNASARGLVPRQTSAHTLRHTFARNYLAQIQTTRWPTPLHTLLYTSSIYSRRIKYPLCLVV